MYWYFTAWEQAKVTHAVLAALRGELRQHEGRDAQPSAGIIDSQSVNGADTVGRRTRGYDAGNHAGRAVMPGGARWGGVDAGQRG